MPTKMPKTRAYYECLPQRKLFDLSAVSCIHFAKSCSTYYKTHKESLARPEEEAVAFYALNHLAAIVQERFTLNEVLPDWADSVLQGYYAALSAQSTRLLYYLVLIVTRESRHVKNPVEMAPKITSMGGQQVVKFNRTILGLASLDAALKFFSYPPDCTLGQYLDCLVVYFNEGKFSSSFGGLPWGEVATTVSNFVNGKTSMEIMVDTGYTLAHNNGPIFNKGMLYKPYQSASGFIRLLDIQRSGQMVELAMSAPPSSMDADFSALVALAVKNLPNVFGAVVDYKKVQDAGAVGNYSHTIKAQKTKSPAAPSNSTAPISKDKAKTPPPVAKEFVVMPGEIVQIKVRTKTKAVV